MENTRRNAYDAAFKLNAIDVAAQEGNRAAARKCGVAESMVRRWRRQHEQLLACKKTTKAFRGNKSRWPELENALEDWVNTQRAGGRFVSTVQIRLKAKTVATEKNIADFTGGPSWCLRFMRRKGLFFRTRTTLCQQLPSDYEDNAEKSIIPDDDIKVEEVPLTCDTRTVHQTVEDIKQRATTLRTQYGRLVKSLGSARKKKPMTLRQRRILKSCNFLKKHISHRVTEDNHNNDVLRTQQDSEPQNQAQPWDFDGRASPSPTESLSVSPPLQSATNNRNNDMEAQNAALLQHMLDVIQETSRQQLKDSEDSFGVTVAMELKRIRNPALRNGVKRQIMTILYDALDSEVVTHPVCHWADESNGCLPQPQHTFPTEESPSITVVIP